MGSVRIGVGTEWLLEGRVYRVVRQPSTDTFIAVDLKFNVEREFTRQDILDQYGQGQLRFATPTTTWLFPPEPAGPRQDVRDLTDQELQILQQPLQEPPVVVSQPSPLCHRASDHGLRFLAGHGLKPG